MYYNMEIQTLGDLLQNQQNQILSLTVHMDCLIEEPKKQSAIWLFQIAMEMLSNI